MGNEPSGPKNSSRARNEPDRPALPRVAPASGRVVRAVREPWPRNPYTAVEPRVADAAVRAEVEPVADADAHSSAAGQGVNLGRARQRARAGFDVILRRGLEGGSEEDERDHACS